MIYPVCSAITPTDGAIIASLFMAGLFGGVMHCAWMCAPFVVMVQQKTTGRLASILLLPYHLGRMTTYVGLGILANLLLDLAFPISGLRQLVSALVLGLAGLVFLAQSLPLLARYMPFLVRLSLPLPLNSIQAKVARLLEKGGVVNIYLVGIILGFIPCALVTGALLAVAALPDPAQAALGMAAFCVGTMPSLITVACGGKLLATILPTRFALLTEWVTVVNGMVLMVLAVATLL